jgi:hypothetical protein
MTTKKPEDRFKFDWQRAVCSEESPLAPTARYVGLARSIHMNGDGTNCYASRDTISKKTGLGLSTVKRADKELIAGGWLVVTFHGGSPRGGVRMATVYRAQIPTTGVTVTPVTQVQDSSTGLTGPPVPGSLWTMTGVTVTPHQSLPIKNTNSATGSRSVDIIAMAEKWRGLPDADFVAHLAGRGIDDPVDVATALEHRRRLETEL